MSAERWLPVPGFEGRYDVSDQGRVRSLHWTHSPRRVPLILKGSVNREGYLKIRLCAGGRETDRGMHQIVLLAFVGPRPTGLVTRHLDGDKSNNTLANLRYGTHAENNDDTVRHGSNRSATKTQCKQGHEYTPENTGYARKPGGGRQRVCVECRRHWGRVHSAARWRRLKAERASAVAA